MKLIIGTIIGMGLMTIAYFSFSKPVILDSVEKMGVVEYAYRGEKVILRQNEVSRGENWIKEFDGNKFQATIYTGPTFFQEGGKWYQIEYATTTKEDFARMTKPTLLARIMGKIAYAVQILSGAGDGRVLNQSISTWATAHDATSGTGAGPTNTNNFVGVGEHKNQTDTFSIFRDFFPFDTSSIPANAKIISASLNLFVVNVQNEDNDGDDWLNVFQSSQATHTTLVAGDFDTIATTTEGATRIDIGSLTVPNAYNVWTLNASGLGWIAKSGVASTCSATAAITCIGVLEGHDALNSAVATNASSTANIHYLEAANDPYLTVVYTVPVKTRIRGWIRFMGGIRFK